MKHLLRKEHYCYKNHKAALTPLFIDNTTIWATPYPHFYKKIFISPSIFQKSQPPINNEGGLKHTVNITHDHLKQS